MGRLLTAIGLFIVLVLAGGFVAPLFIDWNRHKGAIEQEATRLFGLPVAIDGQVDLRLLPVPSLDLRAVRLGRGGTHLAIGQAQLELGISALLTGRLQVNEAVLIGPHLVIGTGASAPQPLPQIDIDTILERLEVRNGSVSLADDAGRAPRIEAVNFVVRAASLMGPWKGEGQFQAGGLGFAASLASGRAGADGLPLKLFVATLDQVLLADIEGIVRAEAGFSLTQLRALNLRGKGRLRGAALGGVRFEAGVEARAGRLELSDPVLHQGEELSPIASEGQIVVQAGAPVRVDGALSLRTLDLDRAQDQPIAALVRRGLQGFGLQGFGTAFGRDIAGRIGVDVPSLTLLGGQMQDLRGALVLDQGRGRIDGFEVKLPGQGTLRLDGDIGDGSGAPRFDGNVMLRVGQPGPFAAWLAGTNAAEATPSMAGAAMPALELRGQVRAGGAQFEVNGLQLQVGAARIGVDAELLSERPKPHLRLRISGGDVDIEPLLAIGQGFVTRFSSSVVRPDAGWPDIDAAIRAEKLRYRDITGLGAEMIIKGDERGVLVSPVRVRLAGSMLSGKGWFGYDGARELTIDAAGEQFAGLSHLLERLLPAVTALRARAALFSPFRLSGTYKLPAKGAGRIAVSGSAGGSKIDGFAAVEAFPVNFADLARFKVSVTNSNGARLMRQAGADGFAFDERSAARVEIVGEAAGALHRVTLEGDVAGVRLNASGLIDHQARAQAEGLTLKASSKDAATFLSLLGVPVIAGGDALPLSLTGWLLHEGGKPLLRIEAADVAGSKLSGALTLDAPGMMVRGALAMERFDLIGAHCLALGLPACGSFEGGWSMLAPTPLLVSRYGFDLRISAREAPLGRLGTIGNLEMGLLIKDGGLATRDMRGTLHGGQMSGEVRSILDGDLVRLSGELSLKDARLQDLTWQMAGKGGGGTGLLEGAGALSLRFAGAGRSQAQLVANLSGNGLFSLPQGRLRGVDTGLAEAALAAESAAKPANAADIQNLARHRMGQAFLPLLPLEAPIALEGGVLRLGAPTLEGQGGRLRGRGAMDLARWRMDGEWSIEDTSAAGQKARLRYGLILRGTPDAPQISIDAKPLLEGLELMRIEREVERLEGLQREIEARSQAGSAAPLTPLPPPQEIAPQEIAPR